MAKHLKHRKPKRTRHGVAFWDKEYSNAEHLALSEDASADLLKFLRWLERETKRTILNPTSSVIDCGCGNGRNLFALAEEFGMHGIGIDSSSAAIREAKRLAGEHHLSYKVRSIGELLPAPDDSQQLALDMMSSHFLNAEKREQLRDEIYRILKPGGYLFMKTFLKDDDLHTAGLLKDRPGPEPGSYIHPVIGVPEYAYGEKELLDFLDERFIVHRHYNSHKHKSKGKARKRRTIAVYAQKDPFG